MKNKYYLGVALPAFMFGKWETFGGAVTENFDSYTCENEMKPEAILVKPEVGGMPTLNYDRSKPAVERALAEGVKMRLHTLVWHSQTPGWFFTRDYTDDGELVDRDTMLSRMEWYIKEVTEHFCGTYPELFYAIDVVNEAYDVGDGDENGVRKKNSRWYETVGPDFVYMAFKFARKYVPKGIKLFYNDYSCMFKSDLILARLADAKRDGLIDGIGMQSHLSVGDDLDRFFAAAKQFLDAGYELQLTELDVGIKEVNEETLAAQGDFYRRLREGVDKLVESGENFTSLTVWGVNDTTSWRRRESPLLYDAEMNKKPAYYGFMKLQ